MLRGTNADKFLAEYKELCLKYNMMITTDGGTENTYLELDVTDIDCNCEYMLYRLTGRK